MTHGFLRNTLISGSIALLHLPLIVQAATLHGELAPGQGLTDLPLGANLVLLALLVLPYAALSALGIAWNPQHARLNEGGD